LARGDTRQPNDAGRLVPVRLVEIITNCGGAPVPNGLARIGTPGTPDAFDETSRNRQFC
jgi:hypothetical protein